MRLVSLILALTIMNNLLAQSRFNKLAVNNFSNFYTYGDGKGSLNNVVRLSESFGFSFKTYDTIKKRGMIYELMTNNPTAYYKNVLPNNTLEVNDIYVNLNLIFPILIAYKERIEHSIGVGVGAGTLADREYSDENNTLLPFNSTNFKQVRFGKYWTTNLLLDYEMSLKFSGRIYLNLGMRYNTSTPVHSGQLEYTISQGMGLMFKYGLAYRF